VLGTNIALYVPSTPEMRNQFQITIAIVIGLVAHAVWRQKLFLKGFGNQRRCMAFGTFGSLEMEMVAFGSCAGRNGG